MGRIDDVIDVGIPLDDVDDVDDIDSTCVDFCSSGNDRIGYCKNGDQPRSICLIAG